MASIERKNWAATVENQQCVEYFMVKAAIAVMNEDPGTASHAERVNYSRNILRGSVSVRDLTVGVTTNATIGAAIDAATPVSDSDLEFVINSLFNAYAGVST